MNNNQGDDAARNPRGKYVTLVILVGWVLAVFVFTLWKFSAIARQ